MADNTVEYIVKLRDEMSGTLAAIQKHTEQMNNSMQQTQGIMSRLQSVAGVAFAVNAVKSFAGSIIETGSNIEQLNVAFSTMLGSKQAAVQMMADITKFAKETPFELTDVASSSKQLLAFGIEQQKVISTLRSLGDVAAGVSAPIGDIAYLYGTINTQGRAMTMDINQFANRGIPIWKELETITGKSGLALRKYVEDGKVDFATIEKAFQNMSGVGGKFFNLMDAQSKTTGGTISNLKDSLGQLANDLFVTLQPAINAVVKSMMGFVQSMRSAIEWAKENQAAIKAIGGAMAVLVGAYILYNAQGAIAAVITAANTVATFAQLVATDGLAAALYAAGIAGQVAWASITLGLSLVVAGFIYAYNKSVWFRSVLHGIGEVAKSLMPLFMGLGEVILGAFTLDSKMFLKGMADSAEGLLNFALIPATFVKGQNEYILEDTKNSAREKAKLAKEATETATDPTKNFDKSKQKALADTKASVDTKAPAASTTTNKATTINITIQKLVDGGINVHTTTIERSVSKIKEVVTQALISAVNDSQIIADS